ncbi:MAG TPA: hypothetical protein VGM21_10100 [Actinomycetota bacterium]|jgi:hypothetical protein
MSPAELAAHLAVDHGQALDGPSPVLAFVHAAMHHGSACPGGHFHDGNQVRRLWDSTPRITEVPTNGHT